MSRFTRLQKDLVVKGGFERMNKYQEALEIIIFRLTSHEEDLELRETDKKAIEIIKQALERLEIVNKNLTQENEKFKKIIKSNFWVFNNDEVLFKFNEHTPVMQEEIKEVLGK